MTITERINDFIPKARTRLGELQLEQNNEFDKRGYQSDRSEELSLMISETLDFIDLLFAADYGGLTEKEISDLIDFFIVWLPLNKVVAAGFVNYTLPIQANVIVPGGSYATAADLAAEITARTAADQALSARITVLETIGLDPGALFPAGFWDNYIGDYSVVFDDDPRLHDHANKAELDQIDATDIINIKGLTAHFESVGTPGGLHVSQEDRDRWDAGSVVSPPIVSTHKTQTFIADGVATSFTITNGLPRLINYVIVNGSFQTPADYTFVGSTIDFGEIVPNTWVVVVGYFEDLSMGDPGGGAGVYDLASPSTVAVGGMPAGTVLTGRSWQSIVEEMTVDYLPPSFFGYSITDMPATAEVGVSIGGIKTFAWNTTNPGNVQANTIAIRDVTNNVIIASALVNDGTEAINLGALSNIVPATRSWRMEGLNTLAGIFVSSNYSITTMYPFFYGKVASGGAAPGASRPVSNQALIDSGNKVVSSSANTITINFGSGSDDYIWFAIPASMASKLSWYVSALNNGVIGGAVGAGGNLFPAPDVVNIDSPTVLWNNVDYKIYVSNYQTAAAFNMELRNS